MKKIKTKTLVGFCCCAYQNKQIRVKQNKIIAFYFKLTKLQNKQKIKSSFFSYAWALVYPTEFAAQNHKKIIGTPNLPNTKTKLFSKKLCFVP
jgi:hypothetical protein